MIADWEANSVYFSKWLRHKYPRTSANIENEMAKFGAQAHYLPATRDIWARDYMPIQVSSDKFVEYIYDPDYLKYKDKFKTDTQEVCEIIQLKTKRTTFILDGGNVVKSSSAVIMTNKVIYENIKNYSEKQLLDELCDLFEVEEIIIIPWDNECLFGHADGMLRFIKDRRILISGFYENGDDEFREMILDPLRKRGFSIEWLRCSEGKEKEDNIAYINFLQTTDFILVPKLNRPEDDKAFDQISKFFPEYSRKKKITQIDMQDIFKKSGALNCISWTIKE